MEIRIPVYKPSLSGNEKKYVNECIDTTWISSKGKFIGEFESAFSGFIGCKHASAVSNGTVAIHLAMLALGIGSGDEVIVPTLTYIASVNAISYVGAKPVFVDSLPDTWQMDPEDVVRKITSKTKCVLAVHLYGQPCDMVALKQICEQNQLFLIEDCAEGIGSEFQNQRLGSFGDISTFSFFGNKTITTGEGGMVLTNNETLHQRVNHFKGQGLAQHRQYWHDVVGYNYRMTNICAAIGLAQFEQIDTFISKKIQIAQWYKDFLKEADVEIHQQGKNSKHTYWMVSVLVKDSKDRDPLRSHLAAAGIETRPLFFPVHTMPMYSKNYQKFSVAEDLGWRGINLPSYPLLKIDDVRFICDQIISYK
ncbi:MAG: DegT/DnrJ/EryC1/StrS family aminotransferase [bacterium]|nr:DegT/DnrJ/EryC1/StrS family aminotransferase [bacterium]